MLPFTVHLAGTIAAPVLIFIAGQSIAAAGDQCLHSSVLGRGGWALFLLAGALWIRSLYCLGAVLL